jgi:hypothetical protein
MNSNELTVKLREITILLERTSKRSGVSQRLLIAAQQIRYAASLPDVAAS